MEEQRMQNLKVAEAALQQLFAEYEARGMIAVYLWGSILRSEYAPNTSDIDSLGIVSPDFDLENKAVMNERLSELAPELFDFRINLVPLTDMQGAPPRSRLATVIPPETLLMEFDTWRHVAGKRFQLSDFTSQLPTAKRALCKNIAIVKTHYIPQIQSGDYSKYKSFLKQMMHVCHFRNMAEKAYEPFSYDTLVTQSIPETRDIVDMLISSRQNGWERLSDDNFRNILSFLGTMESVLCK